MGSLHMDSHRPLKQKAIQRNAEKIKRFENFQSLLDTSVEGFPPLHFSLKRHQGKQISLLCVT